MCIRDSHATAAFSASLGTPLASAQMVFASIITDGCNMGIKSLHEYLNQYQGAAPEARRLTGELADLEASLMEDLQQYL